jgi:hypothetical protein
MSSQVRHRQSRRFKILCAACHERKARFRYRGRVRADHDHTLCFECFRAEINRTRARRISERAPQPVTRPSLAFQDAGMGRIMDARQLAHRQRMLDHLQHAPPMAS